ncbi:MAG TPA: AAA family ATPase [Candidatus Hydrogenedentes bacterium]|nr:AAA family ATPase [Candidatus Hydrogenedentota bacterium]
MLTRLRIRNFKRFEDVDIELGKTAVFIGPNNSGKTTALQALVLWEMGLRRWNEKRSGKESPANRPGVTINRRDLIALPVPDAHLFWHELQVRKTSGRGKDLKTKNIRIEVIVDGISNGKAWTCGFEFDFANDESFYCRPLHLDEKNKTNRMPVPREAAGTQMAFLPPMSGLAAIEPKWEFGRINVLIGEGQTAQVLRNLCFQISSDTESGHWIQLAGDIKNLFGVTLLKPEHNVERGEIRMEYKERSGVQLDLSSAGRGLQQTLLLLAHLYANPRTVLLLDEPDAHLEILRQRQTYGLITSIAEKQQSQIIAASHSEVLLNEAAGRDVVVAFVGKPHRIDDRGSQVLKSLRDIGFDQYYQAEQEGWVLYVERSTDLAILQSFARILGHPAAKRLEAPFVYYIGANQPQKAREHFYGLREALQDFTGIAIFDRLDKEIQKDGPLVECMWRRREIENYIYTRRSLIAFARQGLSDDLFGHAESEEQVVHMETLIAEMEKAISTLGMPSPWSPDIKASDGFLDPLFNKYADALGLSDIFRKSDYHELASLLSLEEIDPEIIEKLDAIEAVASSAKSRMDN